MKTEEAQIRILKVLFYGQLLIEANDELSSTPFFKKQLKFNVNKANAEVEKQIKHQLSHVYVQDNEFVINMFNHIDGLVTKLAKLNIDELPLVNGLLDEFIKDPKYWKENLVLQFNKVI